MGLRIHHRHPRPWAGAAPDGDLEVPRLPDADDPLSSPNLMTSLMPVLGGAGMMLFIVVRPTPLYIAIGIVWLLAMIGAGVAMAVRSRTTQRQQRERTRRDFAAKLDLVARRVQDRVAASAATVASANPPAHALASLLVDGRRLWERASDHEDLLVVRIGTARHEVAVPGVLTVGPVPGTEDSDGVCRDMRDRMLATPVTVGEMPVVLDLRDVPTLRVTGEDRARALVRAAVAQLVMWHSPQDVRLLVCASPERAEEWAWVAWLPHTRWAEAPQSGVGRAVVVGAAAVRAALTSVLDRRRAGDAGNAEPHLLVVLDGVAEDLWDAEVVEVVRRQAGTRLTVVGLGAPTPRRAAEADLVVTTGARSHLGVGDERSGGFVADGLGARECAVLARAMAGRRLAGTDLGSVSAANDSPHLPALLGAERTADLTPQTSWRDRPDRERLAVPIGTTATGEPLVLDVKEAAAGGVGPHGLLVGATGSGKSELLRTLVLGLAVTHRPEDLAFVLVDYKGGAAFAGLGALPHVSGLITNLSDDGSLVERARTALGSEMRRRQEVFAAHDVSSLREYRALCAARPELSAEPTLFVVIDEFAELLSDHRDMGELLNRIGRLGRSLGVHLLLASQRLEGSGMHTLESHLSYRIALRTFTASDSQAVINSRAAHELPMQPGVGLFAFGGDLVRFRAAYVGGSASAEDDSGPKVQRLRAAATTDTEDARSAERPEAGPTAPSATVLEEIVDRYRDAAPRTRAIWVDPLPSEVALSQLLPDIDRDPLRGLCAGSEIDGSRRLMVGLVDRPEFQSLDRAVLDLRGAESTLGIVGGARMGKSTTVATIVVSAALTHTPAEISFYVIDLGGGALESLSQLPHVGAVSGRGAPDRIRRTIADMRRLVDQREALAGRERVAAVDRDVVLVIDGLAELRELSDDYEPVVAEVARRGPGVGVHVIVTASRWSDVRPVIRDHLSGRLELRLTEPGDSVFDRRRAELVSRLPGRALVGAGALLQVCVPQADGDPEPAEMGEVMNRVWDGPVAPPLKMLPPLLAPEELPRTSGRLSLGLDEADLAPVSVDLVDEGPHLLAFGDSGTGRTSVLRHLVHQLAEQPDEPLVYLFDPRLGLMDACPDRRLAGYVPSATAAAKTVAEIVNLMSGREPDADVDRRTLAARSWWSGPQVYLVVDDIDLFAGAGEYGESPFTPLAPFVRRGRDVGLHVIAAGRVKDFHRMLREPVVSESLANGCPTLLLSGDRNEGILYDGYRADKRPPGRALHTRPRGDATVVQTPFAPLDPALEALTTGRTDR